MAKYHLVASYYDIYEKDPNLRYKYEVEVTLPGVDLSTLQAIDCFTASHKHLEILEILSENGINGKNQLAVKYQKNSTSKPEYYRVIENNKEFVECTKNNQIIGYQMFGTDIRALGVPLNSSLFIRERNIFDRLLDESNFLELKKKFPFPKSMLYRIMDEYFNAPHDSKEDKDLVRLKLETEFSRYKTFRGWMIVKGNPSYYERKIDVNPVQPVNVIPKKVIIPKTQEEYEIEYQQMFNTKNEKRGVTYASNQTYQYNTSYLEHDKEEFLTDEEHDNLHRTESVISVPKKSYSRKKKPLRHSRSREDY